MEKTQVVGAMGLAVSMMVAGAVWNNGVCLAQSVEVAGADVAAESAAGGDLTSAVKDARSAREYAAAHPSGRYPGFVKYIDRLLGFAEAEVIEDETELVRALNDAAVAVKLVIGNEVAEREAVAQAKKAFANTQVTQGVERQAGERTVAVQAVAQKSDATSEKNEARGVASESEAALPNVASQDDVALPNTGETRRAGIGELILAGLIVALGTIGATFIIIKDKKVNK